jgi:hypothetical protein
MGFVFANTPLATSVAIFLIALAVALAFLYFGLKWVSRNEDTTRATLAKVGITTPDPPAMDPDPGIAPPPPIQNTAPAPPQPIVLTPPAPTAASVGPACLVDVNGNRFPISDGANLVSRESGAVVLAGEATVSRRHAEVVRAASGFVVRDLGSTNGTFVNGIRVQGEQPLANGDSLRFGAVTMRFEA